MRFTTLSSTTAVIVYLMSVTGSVSAVPIADALAARDMFDAELDIFEARQFHDLEDFDSREVDTALDPIYARFSDLDLDDLEARAPSPGSSNSVKQGIIIGAGGKILKPKEKRSFEARSLLAPRGENEVKIKGVIVDVNGRPVKPKEKRSLEARSLLAPRGENEVKIKGVIVDVNGRPVKPKEKRTMTWKTRRTPSGRRL